MARRIKSRKRKLLGNRTWGAGNTKRRRGKGSKGGKGRAGFHKHKWFQTIKQGRIRGEKGFASPRIASRKPAIISLQQLLEKISRGDYAPDADGVYSLNLEGFKILSRGVRKAIGVKLAIRASGFSRKAKELIEASGGSASLA